MKAGKSRKKTSTMNPFLSLFHCSVSQYSVTVFLFALCWRIRNVSSSAEEPGLSVVVSVPAHQSRQYSPRDGPSEELLLAPPSSAVKKDRPAKLDANTLKMVKSHFGKLFGLKDRPKRIHPSAIHIPEVMLQLYRDSLPADQRVTETEANIVARLKAKRRKPTAASTASVTRSFLHEDQINDFHPRRHLEKDHDHHKEHIFFNTQSIPADDEIKAAELQVFVEQHWSSSPSAASSSSLPGTASSPPPASAATATTSSAAQAHQRLLVRVDEVLSRTGSGDAITRPLDSRLVDVRQKSKYLIFDITPAVQRWQASPGENHGLEVVFLTPDGYPLVKEVISAGGGDFDLVTPIRRRRVRRSADTNHTMTASVEWLNSSPGQHPLALVYSDDAKTVKAKVERGRTRTPTRSAQRPNRQNQCRRYNLNVDFTEIGWNEWILAPPNYNAYFCNGDCYFPLPETLNTTNHATVQSLVHNANLQVVPRPCCVPTDMSPISLLYMDEYEKIVLKNYQDMVIEGCGCR